MKHLNLIVFLFCNALLFGQEEVSPIEFRVAKVTKGTKTSEKLNNGTFDSTFIFALDTLSLPFFDDFSSDLFQKYPYDFTLPGITSEKHYRLKDNVTNVPLAASITYTTQPTFRRVYDLSTSTATDFPFPSLNVKLGDLTSYPPVYATTAVYPPYYIYDTIGVADTPDTVWIVGPDIFQDSATQFFLSINDPSKLWMNEDVYHNYTQAHNPWSLGVATFDGLDANGYPYQIGSTVSNYADVLLSKPIDLSTHTAGDSLYFSFVYQAKGLGDAPEYNDSLLLEFYAKDLDQWIHMWSVNGTSAPKTDWGVVHIPVTNAMFFKKGFQFRLRNYGGMSGALDLFHVDYVHLRAPSGYQDSLFKDFAFSYPVNSLLKDYTSVPWDHFKNNPAGKMSDQLKIVVRNNNNVLSNFQNGTCEVFYNGALEGNYTLMGQTLAGGNINYDPRTTYTSLHDFSSGYQYDPSKLGDKQTFTHLTQATAQFPNLDINDSTRNTQVFANYYSYDDGSAELAYGPTSAQARLAIKYVPYESDSVIGAMIHFVPSVVDLSNKLFLLTLWADNGGVPGAVLYEDNLFFPRNPVYQNSPNGFTTYYFKDTLKVKVDGPFYIGWRQLDPERLNVGLDANIDHKDKTFYSVDNGVSWQSSSFEGSVMIRPIFSTGMDKELGLDQLAEDNRSKWSVFPNPTNDLLYLKHELKQEINWVLYNPFGAMVQQGDTFQLNLSDLPMGMYFLKIAGQDQPVRVLKN